MHINLENQWQCAYTQCFSIIKIKVKNVASNDNNKSSLQSKSLVQAYQCVEKPNLEVSVSKLYTV